MSHNRLLQTYSVKIEIPNSRAPEASPSITVTENWADQVHTQSIALDNLFEGLIRSYEHDKQALHRFSYYLLLKAQSFAQEDVSYQFLSQ
jgi:hypothetical protein